MPNVWHIIIFIAGCFFFFHLALAMAIPLKSISYTIWRKISCYVYRYNQWISFWTHCSQRCLFTFVSITQLTNLLLTFGDSVHEACYIMFKRTKNQIKWRSNPPPTRLSNDNDNDNKCQRKWWKNGRALSGWQKSIKKSQRSLALVIMMWSRSEDLNQII